MKNMNQESINKLKQSMIETYRKFGDDKAILIKGKKSYTGNEIAEKSKMKQISG